MTLKVDHARWKQTPDDLRELALNAPHARTRERFLALYEITQGTNATQVAAATGRHFQSVMAWVHLYNARGPYALAYRRTGGHPPSAAASRARSAKPSPRSTARRPRPRASSRRRPRRRSDARWTIRRLRRWVRIEFGRDLGRETLRRVPHALGLSWKTGKTLLATADPAARARVS